MPVVEKTSGGRVIARGIGEFTLGDRADVDAADAEYLCDERGGFERVDDAAQEADGPADDDVHEEDGPPDGAGPIPDPSDHSVADLRDKLSDIDDVDVLAAVYDAEEAGKDRDTAIEAIQGRINAVRED